MLNKALCLTRYAFRALGILLLGLVAGTLYMGLAHFALEPPADPYHLVKIMIFVLYFLPFILVRTPEMLVMNIFCGWFPLGLGAFFGPFIGFFIALYMLWHEANSETYSDNTYEIRPFIFF